MRIKKNCTLRSIAGENVVILSGKEETDLTKIISLNSTSVLLWKAFSDKDFDKEDLTAFLCSHFDVGKETAEKDVQTWLDRLVECKVIEP